MEYIIIKGAVIEQIYPDYFEKQDGDELEGLFIKTNMGDIKILISNGQYCYEDSGYLFLETPDNINNFIGAEIIKIEDVCVGLTADKDGCGFECGGETQLKVTTNKGVLQFAVYNSHNGYYSHSTFVQVFEKIDKGDL